MLLLSQKARLQSNRQDYVQQQEEILKTGNTRRISEIPNLYPDVKQLLFQVNPKKVRPHLCSSVTGQGNCHGEEKDVRKCLRHKISQLAYSRLKQKTH